MPTKISNKKKIAVAATDKNIETSVSNIFGRCPYFVIAEIQNQKIEKTEIIENKNLDQMGGVGILTAQLMAEKNVNVVIAGNVGPRALDVLKQFKIEIYLGDGAIKQVLQKFIDKKLKKMN